MWTNALRRGFAFLVMAMLAGLAAAGQAGAATFSNMAPITINDSGASCPLGEPSPAPSAATPYPSPITVSGLTGTVTDVNVTLTGLAHTFPDDVDVLLVGPAGQTTILMADSGYRVPFSGTLTFDDAAAASLPDQGQITAGTYKPTLGTAAFDESCAVPSSFPAPAPAGPYGSTLSGFNGTDPNGTWSLYVVDDSRLDAGSIAGGWSLDITVSAPDVPQQIADLQAMVSGLGLPKGLTTALTSTLQDALDALAADDTAGACDSLQAFLNQVAAQKGKKLTTAQAEQLTEAANAIRSELGC
jgi:subtilisin-like proprotein convertase family protein